MPLPGFSILKSQFPAKPLGEVKTLIGGKVNAAWITNACVLRLSRALNYAGREHQLPGPGNRSGLSVVSGADSHWYAYRVNEMVRYLRQRYGAPSLAIAGSAVEMQGGLERKQGIIRFDVSGWSDATGHMDLWNGTVCQQACYFEAGPGTTTRLVELWECF